MKKDVRYPFSKFFYRAPFIFSLEFDSMRVTGFPFKARNNLSQKMDKEPASFSLGDYTTGILASGNDLIAIQGPV